MARPPRFFLPALTVGEVTLDGSEAHHLLNVRRLKDGAVVELFDGEGGFANATVLKTTRRDAVLQVQACEADKESAGSLTIALAFPKPDRARWMVEKLTELGVAQLVPLITTHGVSSAKPVNSAKLNQYVIDACKQARRNTLMRVGEPVLLSEYAKTGVETTDTGTCSPWFLAEQGGSRPKFGSAATNATVLIGPEGGFSEPEKQLLLDGGATAISFSKHVLRVETAAVAAAVLFGQ